MIRLRFAVLLLLLAPAEPSLEDRLAAVKTLMKGEKWQPALAGLRAVFEEFKGAPEVIRLLPGIEEDLRLCTFKSQEKPPTAEQLFGPGTKSYAEATGMLVMEFPKGPVTPPWEGVPPDHANLKIRFEDVAVDYEGSLAERVAVYLSFDFEADTGYYLRPGTTAGQRREQADITRMEGGAVTKRAAVMAFADNVAAAGPHKVRYALKGGELSILLDGKMLVSVKNAKYPRGFVGIGGFRAGSVAVRGKVDPKAMPDLLRASSERRFKEWTEKSWKREDAIPAWAREGAK